MISINFRIIDNIEEIKQASINNFNEDDAVEGFFKFQIDNYEVGYHHNKELLPDELGLEIINDWLENFIKISLLLKNNKSVLFNIDGAKGVWIVFEKDGVNLVINEIINNSFDAHSGILTKKFETYQQGEIKNLSLPVKDFNNEIKDKSKLFLDNLIQINKALKESTLYKRMNDKIKKL